MTCDGVRQAIPYRTLGRFLRLCGTVPGTASNPAASVQVVVQSRVPAVPQSGLSGRAGRDRLGTAAWLKDIPAAKIGHFAGESGALDASEMATSRWSSDRAGGLPAAPGPCPGPR